MSKKETLQEELKSLSPFLQQQKQRPESMHVPEDYFDQLEDAIFSKLESEGALRPALSPPRRRIARPLETSHVGRRRRRSSDSRGIVVGAPPATAGAGS